MKPWEPNSFIRVNVRFSHKAYRRIGGVSLFIFDDWKRVSRFDRVVRIAGLEQETTLFFAIAIKWLTVSALATGVEYPSRYRLSGGSIRAIVRHPFRIVPFENRGVHGEIEFEKSGDRPSAKARVELSTAEFRSSIPEVQEALLTFLDPRANPNISFTAPFADVRDGRKVGETEMLFAGQLNFIGRPKPWEVPLICALTAEFAHCRFRSKLSVKDLELVAPAPMGLEVNEMMDIEGEIAGNRELSS